MLETSKFVTKKDGTKQEFSVKKIEARVNNLLEGLETKYIGIDGCIAKVVKYAHNGKSIIC